MTAGTLGGWSDVIRALLAAVLERPGAALAALPDSTPLFGPELNLDSFSGMALLGAIQARYGVDVAADDLGLDSLETIGTLAVYLASRA